MEIKAKPNNKSFVVSDKVVENFKNEKTTKEKWEKIMEMAKEFDKNNLKRN
jgi:hypothetical protein